MHRSPGVFFDHDKGKSHSSGKLLFAARIIPVSRLLARHRVRRQGHRHARIDRRRKMPVTSLLYALGMDTEEILHTFYTVTRDTKTKDGWRMPFAPGEDRRHEGHP
jgi:DNA-directed RNA polymerase subunit beta